MLVRLCSDALFMAEWRDQCGPTFANLEPTPTRVLDIGCGVYGQWILAAAQVPGWEATRFVGLDLAPVLVPTSMLPAEVRSRVDFVQHDFLQRLPFHDGQFDYIRTCGVTAGVPGPSLVSCTVSDSTLASTAPQRLTQLLHRTELGPSYRGAQAMPRTWRYTRDCRHAVSADSSASFARRIRYDLGEASLERQLARRTTRHPRHE